MIGGVASGIAETYGFDVALVRIACATLAVITFGTAVAAYFIGWAVIPDADGSAIAHDYTHRRHGHPRNRPQRSRVKFWIAIVLFVAGLNAIGDLWSSGWSRFFGPL